MALRFSMILQAVDRATGPAKRIKASVDQMTAGVRQMARANAAATAPAKRLSAGTHALAAGFGAAGRAAKRWSGKAGIASWGDAAEKAGSATGKLLKKVGSFGLTAATWAGGAAVAAGGFALFDLFKTASQFEQYQIMLEGMMGSSAKGKAAMNWISTFAAETPFELDQVTSAFMKLKNAGLDPTNGSLLAAGDAAAGMSEDILRAAEAMAAAMTGEFDSLKALGITASVAGEQVKLSWVKNEKEFTKVASKADKIGLAMAVAAAWSDKFEGSTKRQSTSFGGIISNLKDSWSRFQLMVADAGIFDVVKKKLDGLLAKVNEWAKSGRLQAWAEGVSGGLETAFNWLTSFTEKDFNNILTGLRDAADTAKTIAGWLKSAVDFFNELDNATGMNGSGPAEAYWFSPGYRKWHDSVQSGWDGLFNGAAPGRAASPKGGASRNRAPSIRSPKGWELGPARAPSMLRKRSAQDVQVGGRTVVEVQVKGPATARVRSISASNRDVPMMVALGRSMGGPA